ncbi:MAG: hypothetical protein ACRCVA_21815 [Phreatobacter sp.]
MVFRGLSVDEIKQKAQSSFDTVEQRKRESAKTVAAQQAIRDAVGAKMQRLKALREAKEAVDAQLAAEQAAAKKLAGTGAAKAARKAKATS